MFQYIKPHNHNTISNALLHIFQMEKIAFRDLILTTRTARRRAFGTKKYVMQDKSSKEQFVDQLWSQGYTPRARRYSCNVKLRIITLLSGNVKAEYDVRAVTSSRR